jgi:hypothetical protein
VIPVDPDGRSKSARFRVHTETILAKRIHLPAGEPWRDDYVAEFVEFPRGQFTDQVDATTRFLDQADELSKLKPTPQAGSAILVWNSSARVRTPSSSVASAQGISNNNAHPSSSGTERGLDAGRRSDGRPMTSYGAWQTMPRVRR